VKKLILPILLLALAVPQFASAQCKSFTKKNCREPLEDYTGNGQYNGAVMFEGEEATLSQTFYSGQDYRLFVCSQPSISDSLYFEVMDYRKNVLYSSRNSGEKVFDFTLESTQQLKMRVVVPSLGTANNLKKNGCVSIMVGFKKQE
jgi:hypothetical protein